MDLNSAELGENWSDAAKKWGEFKPFLIRNRRSGLIVKVLREVRGVMCAVGVFVSFGHG